jgi:hypothetical protein
MDKITFCKKNDFKNLIKFLKNNWPNKNTSFNKNFFFNWMYFNKRLNKYNFLIIKKNNKIKACLGIIFNKNRFKQILWFNLWLVDKKNRENINGFDLINYLINNYKRSIIVTSGINENTTFVYNSLRFNVKNLNHYYIINPTFEKYKLIKFNKSEKVLKLNYKKNDCEITVNKKINFLIKNQFLIKYQKIFFKSINYFIKRYQNHPTYNYVFYVIKKNKKIFGFFVGRECSYSKRKALRLVDYFGSTKVIGNIKFNFYNLLKVKKYEYIDFYNFGISKKILKKGGFKINKFSNNIIVPNYYEPFVKKNIKIKCVWWPKTSKLPIFKGDGDQDRPRF